MTIANAGNLNCDTPRPDAVPLQGFSLAKVVSKAMKTAATAANPGATFQPVSPKSDKTAMPSVSLQTAISKLQPVQSSLPTQQAVAANVPVAAVNAVSAAPSVGLSPTAKVVPASQADASLPASAAKTVQTPHVIQQVAAKSPD